MTKYWKHINLSLCRSFYLLNLDFKVAGNIYKWCDNNMKNFEWRNTGKMNLSLFRLFDLFNLDFKVGGNMRKWYDDNMKNFERRNTGNI